ncbi:MAG: hypothetical protein WC052_00035 [Patescibacteria group bacterium]|jgi:hypothetical protein
MMQLFRTLYLPCLTIAILGALVIGVAPKNILAAEPSSSEGLYGLKETATAARLVTDTNKKGQENLNLIIGTLIKTVLGLTGMLFMGMLLRAGQVWLTAEGNEEKITKARESIFNAAVGLLIVFSAYIGTNYLLTLLLESLGSA